MSILAVARLSKNFRGLAAISDVTFELDKGSITSIIGPNGAGKSTLFNLVTGYLAPSAGDVSFNGRRITGMATNRIAELGVGRAFQMQVFRPSHHPEALGAVHQAVDRGIGQCPNRFRLQRR